MAIQIQEAIAISVKFLNEFIKGTQNVLLEEVEFDEKENELAVTLSYESPQVVPFIVNNNRTFKVVRIDPDGKFKSMKMRF